MKLHRDEQHNVNNRASGHTLSTHLPSPPPGCPVPPPAPPLRAPPKTKPDPLDCMTRPRTSVRHSVQAKGRRMPTIGMATAGGETGTLPPPLPPPHQAAATPPQTRAHRGALTLQPAPRPPYEGAAAPPQVRAHRGAATPPVTSPRQAAATPSQVRMHRRHATQSHMRADREGVKPTPPPRCQEAATLPQAPVDQGETLKRWTAARPVAAAATVRCWHRDASLPASGHKAIRRQQRPEGGPYDRALSAQRGCAPHLGPCALWPASCSC